MALTPPDYGIELVDEQARVQREANQGGSVSPGNVHAIARAGLGGAALGLPHQRAIGASFGRHDVSGIRAYVGGPAATANHQLGARAYATGDAIAFAAAPDLRLAAHEAAHVIQQRRGVQLEGGIDRPGDVHERHADAVADKVARGESAEALLDGLPDRSGGGPAIQRQLFPPIPIYVAPNAAVEVSAVDARQETNTSWYVPSRYTGPLANFFRGDVEMTNVASMVANVIAYLDGRRLHRLNIMDHGNQHGVEIGDDWLASPADVARFAPTLGRLRSHFAGNAIVHMQNCEAGQNQAVICALASSFGVAVYAGTGLQNPLYGFNTGDYVSCGPSGTFNPNAGRPSTPRATPEPNIA